MTITCYQDSRSASHFLIESLDQHYDVHKMTATIAEHFMPTYEYLCEANGRVVEVSHKMAEKVKTWGELCKRAQIAPGQTDPKSKVTKLMSAGFVQTGSASEPMCESPSCGMGPCGSGMCGLQ